MPYWTWETHSIDCNLRQETVELGELIITRNPNGFIMAEGFVGLLVGVKHLVNLLVHGVQTNYARCIISQASLGKLILENFRKGVDRKVALDGY